MAGVYQTYRHHVHMAHTCSPITSQKVLYCSQLATLAGSKPVKFCILRTPVSTATATLERECTHSFMGPSRFTLHSPSFPIPRLPCWYCKWNVPLHRGPARAREDRHSLPPTVSGFLSLIEWEPYLSSHPDKAFAAYLQLGIMYGFRIGLDRKHYEKGGTQT